MTCNYYMLRGSNKDKKCSRKTSKLDPEHKFCSAHKRCVYPYKNKESEEKADTTSLEIKLLDFITFKMSCIDCYIT